MVKKTLTDDQIKFLNKLLRTRFLHKISIKLINGTVDRYGVMGMDVEADDYVWFVKMILKQGCYGTNSDIKKLNAFRELYLRYGKKI